jgi:hypothetical protein
MRYPNLIWAICQWGPRYKFAASIGESESWRSRRLGGRVEVSDADRGRITRALSYPSDWSFEIPNPPKLATSTR